LILWRVPERKLQLESRFAVKLKFDTPLVGRFFFNQPTHAEENDADNRGTSFRAKFGVAEWIAQSRENANQNDQQSENL